MGSGKFVIKIDEWSPLLNAINTNIDEMIEFITESLGSEAEIILMGNGGTGTTRGNFTRKGTRDIGAIPIDTGHLLHSLHMEKPDINRRVLITNTPYAKKVHDGLEGQRPQPYMSEMIEVMKGRWKDVGEDALGMMLDKYGRK